MIAPAAPAVLSAALLRDPVVLIVSGFGSGFIRPAPGTWGSLLAVALWWWLLADLAWPSQLAAAAAMFGAGVWCSHEVALRYGVTDDPAIVADEIVGQWLALLAAPVSLPVMLAALLLFRTFDILKPGPIRWAEHRLPGAWGVMVDDVIAGLLAAAVLQLALLGFASLAALPAP